jgi:hypothetical protein
MGSKKQRNKVNLEKVFELPQMSEEMGQPVFIRSFDDAIKAAEHFGCDVIWGANLENGLPVPFPTGEIWVVREGHWVLQDKDYRCSCPDCLNASSIHSHH